MKTPWHSGIIVTVKYLMCKQEWAVCPLFSFMEKEEMAKKNVKNIVEILGTFKFDFLKCCI